MQKVLASDFNGGCLIVIEVVLDQWSAIVLSQGANDFSPDYQGAGPPPTVPYLPATTAPLPLPSPPQQQRQCSEGVATAMGAATTTIMVAISFQEQVRGPGPGRPSPLLPPLLSPLPLMRWPFWGEGRTRQEGQVQVPRYPCHGPCCHRRRHCIHLSLVSYAFKHFYILFF